MKACQVSPDTPATIVNIATVSGGGDPNGGNNQASDPVTTLAGAGHLEIPTLSSMSMLALLLVLALFGAREARTRVVARRR
jgi:hypothetical protein